MARHLGLCNWRLFGDKLDTYSSRPIAIRQEARHVDSIRIALRAHHCVYLNLTDFGYLIDTHLFSQSVVWLGLWGYVIGVFWLLVGVLWALATCCYFCCCRSKTAKTSGYSRGYYCCPAVVVILLSAIAL